VQEQASARPWWRRSKVWWRIVRDAVSLALAVALIVWGLPRIAGVGWTEILKPFREEQIFDSLERRLGVRFAREEAKKAAAPVLSLARLAQVPEAQRLALLGALGEGDDLAARRAVEAIADRELAAELMARVRNFEFDQILALLERVT